MANYSRSVLITDLDDTLWSWIEIWHASFHATVQELLKITKKNEQELLDEIKKIHVEAGTSEYTFLVHKLENNISGETDPDYIRLKYKAVFEAQKKAKKAAKPFDDTYKITQQNKITRRKNYRIY